MSNIALGLVWESDIGPATKRIALLALADNADSDGYCWPGIEYLIGKTALSRATLYRALNDLEEDRLIKRTVRRRPNGTQRSNIYTINLKLLAQRKRKITAKERDEEAGIKTLVQDDDPQNDRVSERETAKSEPLEVITTGSHRENGRVSERDGNRLTVRPLEPSLEPSVGNPQQLHTTRERAAAAEPPGVIEPLFGAPSSELVPVDRKPARRTVADQMEGFADFYAAYPKRVGRLAAEKAWLAARRRGVEVDHMILAAKRYAGETRDRESRFVKHPASWLNAGSYDNEPEVRRPVQTKAEAKFQRHVQQHHDLFDEDGNFRVDPYSVTADLDHRAIGQ